MSTLNLIKVEFINENRTIRTEFEWGGFKWTEAEGWVNYLPLDKALEAAQMRTIFKIHWPTVNADEIGKQLTDLTERVAALEARFARLDAVELPETEAPKNRGGRLKKVAE